jgi:hypothetical protein
MKKESEEVTSWAVLIIITSCDRTILLKRHISLLKII